MRRFVFVLAMAVAACAHRMPMHHFEAAAERPKELCLLDNPAILRAAFQPALVNKLESKGIAVRVIKPGTDQPDCKFIMSYTAHWSGNIDGSYLHSATFVVRRGSTFVGEATNSNILPYQPAATSIRHLIDELFPDSAPASQ
jgi:hypothetical protein